MGRPVQVINQIINGSKAITARTARELEAALGPDAQTWLNLETSWRLYIEAKADPAIAARAKRRVRHRPTGQLSGPDFDGLSRVGPSEREGLGLNVHVLRQLSLFRPGRDPPRRLGQPARVPDRGGRRRFWGRGRVTGE